MLTNEAINEFEMLNKPISSDDMQLYEMTDILRAALAYYTYNANPMHLHVHSKEHDNLMKAIKNYGATNAAL